MIKIIIVNLIMLFALCGQVSAVTGNNYNQSLNNRYLGYETTRNILTKLEYTSITEEKITAFTDNFNLWFENYSDQTVTLRNIVFYRFNDTNLNWIVSNGTFSSTLKYIYLGAIPFEAENNLLYYYFEGWITDEETGAITGASTSELTERFWASTSSYGKSNSAYIPTYAEYTEEAINLKRAVAPIETFVVYAKTYYYGYKSYFLSNTYELAINPDAIITPTPTPTPNPTKTPTSGDYGPAIDNINNNLNNINGTLNNIENTIVSGNQEILDNMLNSGDLGIILGETTLSGDEWIEEESSGFLGGLLKGIWGVFNKIWKALFEVDNEKVTELINNFNTVLEANSNLLGLPLYLITSTMNTFIEYEPQDFILSWNAINYQGFDVIPAGQINFNEFVNNNEKFKEIYDIMILIESIGFIFLFASWLRNMFLDLLGINWLGLASEEPEVETTYAMDTIVDHNTGEIVSEINTKTTRNNKTGETHRIKDVWKNNIYKRGRR